MNIDWQHYHAPNKEAIKEIPSQLDYLFSANDSPENIEYFLYNELAPNIKHQFKIYNVIVPIIRRVNQQVQNYKRCLKNSHFGVEKFNFSLGLSFNFFCMDIILLSV